MLLVDKENMHECKIVHITHSVLYYSEHPVLIFITCHVNYISIYHSRDCVASIYVLAYTKLKYIDITLGTKPRIYITNIRNYTIIRIRFSYSLYKIFLLQSYIITNVKNMA